MKLSDTQVTRKRQTRVADSQGVIAHILGSEKK
jgi:hypothetical protein